LTAFIAAVMNVRRSSLRFPFRWSSRGRVQVLPKFELASDGRSVCYDLSPYI